MCRISSLKQGSILSLELQHSFNSSTIGLNVKIDFNLSFFLKDHIKIEHNLDSDSSAKNIK
ncbi:hypothetical protein BpHYR1_046831 [Brachionus plicatilis]|uniref:Uncharacterized protein n=1 Tax=Brachionus plicatilis TaxID=10195 RepID=A0A3M7S0Q1_BRAPC|nr:hypothetical protein BpHYR1_046831 [Brachionus plicatilis]